MDSKAPIRWVDATLGVAFATAGVFLVGYLTLSSYYESFGISTFALGLSAADYMAASFLALYRPALAYVLLVCFVRAVQMHRNKGDPESRIPWPLAGPALAIGVLLFTWRLMALGDNTRDVLLGISMLDAALAMLLFCLLWFLFLQYKANPDGKFEAFLGNSGRAALYSSLGLFLILASSLTLGADRANDQNWGCVPRQFVDLEPWPSSLNDTHGYWLIEQTPTTIYLRDNSTPNREAGYVAVPLSSVDALATHQEPAETSCSGTRWPWV